MVEKIYLERYTEKTNDYKKRRKHNHLVYIHVKFDTKLGNI